MLRDRLFHAQGVAAAGPQPSNSFNRVSTAKPAAAAHASAPKAQVMVGNYCVVNFLWHAVRRFQTIVISLWFSGSIPAGCSHQTAASSAISLHSTSSSSQFRARSATFISCCTAQCDPPCHEASVPPARSSSSWSEMQSLLTAFSYCLCFHESFSQNMSNIYFC